MNDLVSALKRAAVARGSAPPIVSVVPTNASSAVRPRAAPSPARATAASAIDADNPFGAGALLVAPGDALVVAVTPASVLGGFAGARGLIGALVFSEALAPPLALREPSRAGTAL